MHTYNPPNHTIDKKPPSQHAHTRLHLYYSGVICTPSPVLLVSVVRMALHHSIGALYFHCKYGHNITRIGTHTTLTTAMALTIESAIALRSASSHKLQVAHNDIRG